MLSPKQRFGREIENFAKVYLQQQGLKFVAANYSCKSGEIDLIMYDDKALVFVEVRYRKSSRYGDPVATVNRRKQKRIINAATRYLQTNKIFDKVPCRFDIVAVSKGLGPRKDKGLTPSLIFDWIKDAFWVKW